MTESALAGPVPPLHVLVDHAYPKRADRVIVREDPPFANRDAHGRKELPGNTARVVGVERLAGRRRLPLDADGIVVLVPAEGQVRREADSRDPRQGAKLLVQPRDESESRLFILIAVPGQGNRACQEVFRAKPRVHREHLGKAEPQEARAGDQREGQGKLRHNQRVPEPVRRARRRAPARFHGERHREISPHVVPEHRQRQQQAHEQRGDKGREADSAVESVWGEVGEVVRAEGLQAAQPGPAKAQAQHAPREGKRQGLREELPGDLEAARAENLPKRELLGPGAGADKEQVCQVDGADQEQEEHPGLQQQEHGARLGDEIAVEVDHGRMKPRVDDQLRIWILLKRVLVERVHLRLGIADRRPGAKPGDHRHVVAVPLILLALIVAEAQRRPDLGHRRAEGEAGRHDPDDGLRLAVHPDLPSDDGGIGPVSLPPEAVAQDEDIVLPVESLLVGEGSAQGWRNAKHPEE